MERRLTRFGSNTKRTSSFSRADKEEASEKLVDLITDGRKDHDRHENIWKFIKLLIRLNLN